MDGKKILWGALILVVLLVVVIGIGSFSKSPAPAPTPTASSTLSYSNAQFGVAFQYPDTYDLQERTETFEGNPLLVLTLIDKAAVVPEMSEGPTAISVIVAQNASSTPLATWVQSKSISNFYLSQDKALASTTFMGNNAVLYRYSGLYENDAIAMAHSNKIYLFSVSWAGEQDAIRHDFEHVVESVRLQ